MKVLFISPAPLGISPGQRFRFEHYLRYLTENQIQYEVKPFFNIAGWRIIYKNGNILKKIFFLTGGLIKRIGLLFRLGSFDVIYIYREVLPFGPPVFEWLIGKLFQKKIIYDFDDAIWIPLSSDANPIAAKIKCTWKVAKICKWSSVVTVGNQFLAAYAKQYCNNTRIIPTVVDTENVHNNSKNQEETPLTIGWTGTFTNFIHLPLAIPAIKQLQDKYDFDFLIIADKDPVLKDIKYSFTPWNKETEITDLLKMHIGIMPLINTDVQLGKCAFKAIQYMSLGIPAVVTPIGANCEVVDNGINGYWADTDNEWYDTLEQLIINKDLRYKLGTEAKEKITKKYSVKATADSFICLFAKAFN
jgi:glycosyltransferase involved in cell wall biosynthesis